VEAIVSISALGLLFLAAILHASYHLFYKRSLDKQVFAWCLLLVTIVAYFPLFVTRPLDLPPLGWACVLASGLAEAAYFLSMGKAYQTGDLSVAYPLARGSAPLFITLWATLLLKEQLTTLGLMGIILIAGGLYLINARSWGDLREPLRHLGNPSSRWALLTGLCISIYSTIDKVGTRYVPPFVYIYLVLLVTFFAFTPGVLLSGKRASIAAEWRVNKVGILVAGIADLVTYYLVLLAMRLSYVSYVGSVREMSVVLGAFLGSTLLREGYGRVRILASVLVFLGILLIGVAG
jgi:drug/metabolite transporter (DMT)-like permease